MGKNMLTAFVMSLAVLATTTMSPHICHAAPKITVSASEGYLILFKDDSYLPGPASTRFGVGLGLPLDDKWTATLTFGVNIPNTEFKPFPRVILGANYKLTTTTSFNTCLLYQLNYGYSGASTTHLLGLGVGPSAKIGDTGLSASLTIGPAKTLGANGLWSFLFQPGVSW